MGQPPTLDAYEVRAIALAQNAKVLAALRDKLARNRDAPLFDATAFATEIETVYRAMHARRIAGLPPDHIAAGEAI